MVLVRPKCRPSAAELSSRPEEAPHGWSESGGPQDFDRMSGSQSYTEPEFRLVHGFSNLEPLVTKLVVVLGGFHVIEIRHLDGLGVVDGSFHAWNAESSAPRFEKRRENGREVLAPHGRGGADRAAEQPHDRAAERERLATRMFVARTGRGPHWPKLATLADRLGCG